MRWFGCRLILWKGFWYELPSPVKAIEDAKEKHDELKKMYTYRRGRSRLKGGPVFVEWAEFVIPPPDLLPPYIWKATKFFDSDKPRVK